LLKYFELGGVKTPRPKVLKTPINWDFSLIRTWDFSPASPYIKAVVKVVDILRTYSTYFTFILFSFFFF